MRKSVVFGLGAGLVALGLAGCSDRDSETNGPTNAATVTATTSAAAATGTPTPTPVPGKELAERLAQSPQYFIYVAGPGDSVKTIADTLDGISNGLDADFVDEIKKLNGLTSDSVPVGQELAVPLRLPTAQSFFQDNSVAAVLAANDPKPVVAFLRPSTGLRDSTRGLIGLYKLQLDDGNAPGETRGFYAVYSTLDRVGVKAGELDAEARVTGEAFAVAGGSMVAALQADYPDAYVFRRSNVTYAVAPIGLTLDGPTIAGGLQAAAP